MKIGFFDSGIGGMTVLERTLRLLPREDYIYYADTLHLPYGEKSKQEVRHYVFEAIDFIAKRNVKAIVIACNAATSAAAQELRAKYRFPIIGIEPAIKPAIKQSREKGNRVLVFSTHLTLREEKYNHLVRHLDDNHLVDGLPMPRLVEFAEQFEFREEVISAYLKKQLAPYDLQRYGTVVLGCTHFPIYQDMIQNLLPADIEILDGGIGTAQNAQRTLAEMHQIGDGTGQIEYYISGEKVENSLQLTQYAALLDRLRKR